MENKLPTPRIAKAPRLRDDDASDRELFRIYKLSEIAVIREGSGRYTPLEAAFNMIARDQREGFTGKSDSSFYEFHMDGVKHGIEITRTTEDAT